MEGEKRMAAVGMASQWAWMKSESAVTRRILWHTLWKMEPIQLQFTVGSTYDLLPRPTNLMRLGKSDDAKCGLSSEPGHWSISSPTAKERLLKDGSHGIRIRSYERWLTT